MRELLEREEGSTETPPKSVGYRFWLHEAHPLPFVVIDQIRLSDDEEVVWIRHELGHSDSLPAFAAEYMDLFGMHQTRQTNQKSATL